MCAVWDSGLHGKGQRVKAPSECSKWVVNSVSLSRDLPVFPGFFEIIRVFITGIIIFKLSQYKSAEEKERDRQEGKIARFRSFWGSFVVYVISTSLISLFLASFVSKQNITLNDINTWVSLILGMVALVIGVISLFLSFYNVDQAYQSQKDSLSEMKKVQESLSGKLEVLHSNMQRNFNKMLSAKSGNKNFVTKTKNGKYGDYMNESGIDTVQARKR